MLDHRFSLAEFDRRGLDTEEAQQLAELLAEEVTKELQTAIEPVFRDIVLRLNEMGHQLKPEQVGLGEISYRDDYSDQRGYHCKLRLALDLILSAGYAHINFDEA